MPSESEPATTQRAKVLNASTHKMAIAWPTNFKRAWEEIWVPEIEQIPKGICITGMGGSAIGGDLCKTILGPVLSLPLETVKGYELPAWVGDGWLVIAISYSGNTEETLQTFSMAGERGCSRLVITTGGELARVAEDDGVSVVRVPGGYQPRAALPFLLAPLLKILSIWCEDVGEPEVERVCEELAKELAEGAFSSTKQLARELQGNSVVIYGWEQFEAVAYRWQTQLNENAKVMVFHQCLPEANHNDIVGWESAPENMVVVLLRSHLEPRQVRRRFKLTWELVWQPRAKKVLEVEAKGDARLGQVLWLLTFGDLVSLHLADMQGVEAEPVEVIESLKTALSQQGE